MLASLAVSEHPKRFDFLESLFPNMEMEEQVDGICKILNIGKERETSKEISFLHIPDFIESVMVHPLAPFWYEKIVSDYCKLTDIPFEGKSELYK